MVSRIGKPQLAPRMKRKILINGAQSSDLNVRITFSQGFNYDSAGKVDPGADISTHFRRFGIQMLPTASGQVCAAQLNIGGGWTAVPDGLIMNDNANKSEIAATGGIMFIDMPINGAQLRFSVTQPVSATNMSIFVLLDGLVQRRSS